MLIRSINFNRLQHLEASKRYSPTNTHFSR